MRDDYPKICEVVVYVELILCGTDEKCPISPCSPLVSTLLNSQYFNPIEGVSNIRKVVEVEILEPNILITSEVFTKILTQVDDPSFLTYIAGKMGCM